MTRRVYGEISLEDYQQVLDAVERRKRRVVVNRSAREVADDAPETRKSTLWNRIKGLPKPVLVGLLIVSTYCAGATWQWGGRWSKELNMEQLTLVAEDATYPDDRTSAVVVQISRRIHAGLNALGVVAGRDAPPGILAVEELQHWSEQARGLLEAVRDR